MRRKIPTGLIGMVHLKALPGSPGFAGDIGAVESFALADVTTLLAGGVDAILVENFGTGTLSVHSSLVSTRLAVARGTELPGWPA